jgi:hypothetical protein
LITAVEKFGVGLRGVAAALAQRLELTEEQFDAVWGPKSDALGYCRPGSPDEVSTRAAWCLIAEWLLAVALEELDPDANLADAHAWFTTGASEAGPSIRVPDIQPSRHGLTWTSRSELFGLLPYLLDPASPATRRDVLRGRAVSDERHGRKSRGVFFTPSDAAHFMVRGIGDREAPMTWLDPAAGSGVFLRAVAFEFPSAEVFGIDINPAAAEMAAFTLMSVRRGPGPAWSDWHRSRRCLATGDALTLAPANARKPSLDPQEIADCESPMLGAARMWRLADAFPALDRGVDAVIQNPPYSVCAPDRRQAVLSRWGSIPSNIYPLFLRAGLEQMVAHGRMAAVVPASLIASSATGVLEARTALMSADADIEILNFDRAPDGLFGDDVKTRCSVVFCDRAAPARLRVSGLIRITSNAREAALQRHVGVELPLTELAEKHPAKPGTSQELPLLRALRASPRRLCHDVLATRTAELAAIKEQDTDVLVGPTAYNWLNVQRDPEAAMAAGHNSRNAFVVLRCADGPTADAVYAMLSSRLSLWAWRTFGDGFHVSRWLLDQLPGVPNQRLALTRLSELGAKLWVECRGRPVTALNGGRTTVAFPPYGLAAAERLLSETDEVILASLKLSDLPVNLAAWARKVAAAGRTEERTGAVPWSEAS